MGNILLKIQNGTQTSTANLCVPCRHAHRTVSAQSGRERVRCAAMYNQVIEMREQIAQCNAYLDRTSPTLYDMQEIAWSLMTDKGGRKIGFQSPEERNNGAGPSVRPVGF